MTVEIVPEPDYETCLSVARNLRERDREELFATSWTDTAEEVAERAAAAGAMRWVACLDGEPVALIGVTPRWPKVWQAWAFGTDHWPRVVLSLTRHARRFMLPAVFHSGAIRVECYALESHTDARRWLVALGAQAERTLPDWGKQGETFVVYRWTRQVAARMLDGPRSRRRP